MMKVDELYLENLFEYVFDDKLFVTYKFISVKLGVHVNLAKQMLYHFYDTQKAKGKNICATYYLSGLAPQKWISSIKIKEDSEQEEFISPSQTDYDKDAYLILLCKDHELEDMKKKFSRLYSVHIYGLSASANDTLDVLNKTAETQLRDDKGNTPVHYGPITCKAAFEYREDPRLAPLIKNVQEVKIKVEKAKEKHKQDQEKVSNETNIKPNPPKSEKSESVQSHNSKKTSESSVSSNDKSRLKNMFAAAASRPPKPKEPEKPKLKDPEVPSKLESKSKSEVKSFGKSREKDLKAKAKEKDAKSRKRKRIKDVFSSSDEEEDEKTKVSDSDEEGLPESPIPRKLLQIESDSDDDFKEARRKKSPTPPPITEKSANGKRRVSKTVPKRHVDEQGFLVTVMEQIMVSESDNSEDEGKTTKETSDKLKKSVPQTEKTSSTTKKDPPNKSNSSVPGKKQSSIMSFFQKK